ncbi:MAG: autotransporter assembly complex protein TamA, partial [Alphaproteobacteria bacterium]
MQVSQAMLERKPGQGAAPRARGRGTGRAGWRLALALLLAGMLAATGPARALPYEVHVAGSGDDALDRAISSVSTLVRLSRDGAADGFSLVARAREDAERLEDAARSLGFYGATVDVHLAGRPAHDSGLAAALEAGDPAARVPVDITVAAGPAYRVRRIAIDGLPTGSAARPRLEAGQQARAADILAAEDDLREALRAEGHAFARIARRELLVDHDARAMDVAFVAEPGPRVAFGAISLGGLGRADPGFVRRRLGVAEGEEFDPRRLAAGRDALAQTGVFSSVRVRAAELADASGRVPVHVDVVERPPRSIAFGAAWSTDEGGMLNARWQHRNLLGGGEQLRLSAELSHLFVNSVEDFAGRVDAQLRLPDLLAPGLSLRLDAGAVRERLDAYDRDAMFAGAAVERRISRELVASLGGLVERSHVVQGDDERFYTLVSMPGTLEWDSSDDRLEPTRGWRLGGTLAPAKSFTDTQGGFASARGAARTYLDLGGTGGRSVLALRAGAGSILA